jgi:16S rRNA (cytosine1402-N4)-methyltransferase
MRMNPQRGIPAAEWIARTTESKLAELLAENADEPQAEPIAHSVCAAKPQTTRQLAAAIRTVHANDETVRRVFQALRVVVNDEFGALQSFLHSMPLGLKPGGRVALLTFHSGEDRRVKKAFQELERGSNSGEIQSGLMRPAPEEVRSNPRSRSAKLRWLRFVS